MTLGMVLTIQGKVPMAYDESKENMAPTGGEASEWKVKHMCLYKKKGGEEK